MNPITAYRLTVAIAPILGMVALFYTEVAKAGFSQEWQDLLTWSGDGGLLPTSESESGEEVTANEIIASAFALSLVVVSLANQVAMFFFWRPSRHVFAIICLLGFLASPSFGLLVAPPIEYFLVELSMFISGMTLALCYFSDTVVSRFLSIDRTEQGEALNR